MLIIAKKNIGRWVGNFRKYTENVHKKKPIMMPMSPDELQNPNKPPFTFGS